MNNKIYFLLIIVMLLAGCKSTKNSYDGPAPDRTNLEILKALEDNNTPFEWYSYKGDIKVDLADDKFKGSTQVRMKKDSAIWILIKKISIEGARVLITPEKMTVINRIERTYSVRNTYSIFDLFSLDLGFTDLQQLVIGNVILPPDDNYEVKREEKAYFLSFHDGEYEIEYKVNAYDLHIEQSRIFMDQENYIQVNFDDYKKVKKYGKFPFKRTTQLYKNGKLTDQVILDAKEIKINEPKTMPFEVNPRYDEVY